MSTRAEYIFKQCWELEQKLEYAFSYHTLYYLK